MAWHNSLTENLGWKIASVILATLIWLSIHFGYQAQLGPGIRRELSDLPITVMTTANENRSFVVEPGTVKVAVRGESSLLNSLRPSDIAVFVNLTGISEARGLRKKIEVHTPSGVSLVWVVPTEVRVESLPETPDAVPSSSP